MHKNLVENIYPFPECKFCDSCIPNAVSLRSSPLGCDRCAMGSKPDRFIPIKPILITLYELDKYKNNKGKIVIDKKETDVYHWIKYFNYKPQS